MGTVKYTGPVASFHCPTNAEIRSLKVHFSPKQEGSGDPSPENVRPIVGWDGVEVYRNDSTTDYEFGVLGKNKFDYSTANIIDKKRRDDTGTVVSDATGSYCQTLISVRPNVTYTLSGYPVNNSSKRIYYIDAEENFIERTAVFGNDSYTFTTPNNCYYIQIQNREVGENASWETIQLELGSSATTYEPYDPNHTVYGGWVDLISGEVCEEYGFLTESSGGTLASIVDRNDGYYSIIFNFDTNKRPYSGSGSLCNILNYNSTLTAQNNEYAFYYYLNQQAWKAECRIYSATPLTTVDEAKTYLNQLGFKLAYKIPTPITYQLAPTSMQTFLAHNNIWSNADYVEVEYDLHETQNILARKQFIIANQPHIESASSAMVNFETDLAAPLKECKVYFKPIQEGSGDPSPENVREINGWDGVITSANRAPLPEEYQEVEYIQSTSIYSYFITDYYPNDKTDYYIKIYQGNATTDNFHPTAFSAGELFELYKTGYYVWYQYKGESSTSTSAYGTNRDLLEISLKGNTWTVITPGQRTTSYNVKQFTTFQCDQPLILLAREVDGIIRDNKVGDPWPQLYRLTLYENEVTVRDYIPCYRKSDNEVGLYDLVNKTFLTHSGEGTFTAGPDITTGSIIYTNWASEAGTIYGGYIDLITGQFVNTHMLQNLAYGSANIWYVSDASRGIFLSHAFILSGFYSGDRTKKSNCVCDKLKVVSVDDLLNNYTEGDYCLSFFINSSGSQLTLIRSSYFINWTTQQLYDFLADTIPHISGSLPPDRWTTYQLTPIQLKTLRNTNNIWSNANGDIEVKYWTH